MLVVAPAVGEVMVVVAAGAAEAAAANAGLKEDEAPSSSRELGPARWEAEVDEDEEVNEAKEDDERQEGKEDEEEQVVAVDEKWLPQRSGAAAEEKGQDVRVRLEEGGKGFVMLAIAAQDEEEEAKEVGGTVEEMGAAVLLLVLVIALMLLLLVAVVVVVAVAAATVGMVGMAAVAGALVTPQDDGGPDPGGEISKSSDRRRSVGGGRLSDGGRLTALALGEWAETAQGRSINGLSAVMPLPPPLQLPLLLPMLLPWLPIASAGAAPFCLAFDTCGWSRSDVDEADRVGSYVSSGCKWSSRRLCMSLSAPPAPLPPLVGCMLNGGSVLSSQPTSELMDGMARSSSGVACPPGKFPGSECSLPIPPSSASAAINAASAVAAGPGPAAGGGGGGGSSSGSGSGDDSGASRSRSGEPPPSSSSRRW